MKSHTLLALGGVAVSACLLAPAMAQSGACAPDDLKCRVAALEARLATLEGKQAKIETKQAVAEARDDTPANIVKTFKMCRANCQEEAEAVCKAVGFAGGRAKTFERPKVGPTILKLAECQQN